MLIALEMIKMPSFSPFTDFFGRVKLVHLVLLVLVVVLEREENLVLRVMPAHLGPRYVNNTRDLRGAVSPALHRALGVLCSGTEFAALVTHIFIFPGPSWKSWKPWQQG